MKCKDLTIESSEITGLFPFSTTFSLAECKDLRCMSSYEMFSIQLLLHKKHLFEFQIFLTSVGLVGEKKNIE